MTEKLLIDGNERPRGLLTKTDRAYLSGELEYDRPQDEYNIRRRIRERVYHALIDGHLLKNMAGEDRRRVFDPSQDPRTPPESQVEAHEEIGRQRRDAITDAERIHLENALVQWLAFLFENIDERSSEERNSSFESLQRDAIWYVAERNGWIFGGYDLILDLQRDVTTSELVERFEAEEPLTNQQLEYLFRTNEIDFADLEDAIVRQSDKD